MVFIKLLTDLVSHVWVDKTQLLCVYLQLLLADKNGFTSLQCVMSTRIYTSRDCLHPYFQM